MPPITLDPIVSLSVAIAETPGGCAFFLGSGVSRDTGIPTGGEILRSALADLSRLETPEGEDPPADLDAWLDEQGRRDLTYSQILEALLPQPDDRRAYLARHLEGREPGETHRRLAALAADGSVRVYVTTNFDRLLERALRNVGLEPVVVATDDDLERAPAREHSRCFVLKVHGDMLQRTIRNTDAELAALDPGVDRQLREVLDRYGVLVLGYSGSDPAVRDALAARSPRHGLYWMSRAPLEGRLRDFVQSVGGRVIVRDSASRLLRDLQRRLALYRAHPSGETPATVDGEAIRLLRAGDDVGLRELALAEEQAFVSRAREVVLAHKGSDANAPAVGRALAPALERFLAVHLPLIRHGSPLFAERAVALARLGSMRFVPSGSAVYVYMAQWLAWWLARACGGYAVVCDNVAAIRGLFDAVIDAEHFGPRSLALTFAGDAGEVVAQRTHADTEHRYIDPTFAYLVSALRESDWLRERYPDYVAAESDESRRRPEEPLLDFSLLCTLKAGQLGGERHLASWTAYGNGGEHLAQRLLTEPGFRARVAESLFELSVEDFDARIRTWLDSALPPGAMPRGYNDSDAGGLLAQLSTSGDD